ncbi:MAG: S-layer homology domain-containing protein [Clostridia bacterium]|nr:S-layer homology domain-containing protein [Clostridia bacterium]
MKKIISAVLAATVFSSIGVTAVTAKSKIESVLADVKTRIMDTSVFDKFDSSSNTDISGREIYHFNWSTSDSDNYRYLNVSADGNGVILNYYYDDSSYNYSAKPSFNKISSDEALESAKKLLRKLNPDICDSLIVEKTSERESLFDSGYWFNVSRQENNIKVYNDTGSIRLNKDATAVTDFYIDYTPGLNFEDADSVISNDELWEKFSENAGLELQYLTKYDDGKKTVYLAYLPDMEYDQYIDAESGEIKYIESIYYYSGGGGYNNFKQEAAADDSGFTPQETKELDEVSNLISKENAEKKIRENSLLDINDKMVLNSFEIFKDSYSDKRYANLNFSYDDDNDYYYAYASLDAKTGELLSWSSYGSKEDDDAKYSNEQLKELAKNALPILSPKHFSKDSKSDYREYTPEYANEDTQGLYFYRYVNDVVYKDDSANIIINPSNGKVKEFHVTYSDMDFPAADNILSEQDAVRKFSEQADWTLYYIPQPSKEDMLYYDTAYLGYKLDGLTRYIINPETGIIIKDEYEISKEPIVYDDIKGHYAEKQISELAKYGIGFDGGKFIPDELITQKDFVTLLSATIRNNEPIVIGKSTNVDWLYKDAKRGGILKADEENADLPITRSQAAMYFIRCLGLEETAQLPGIYKSLFSDVTENVGYISILGAMKIFNGDENGNFNPDKQLTRADSAILIYNYLSR